MECEAFNELLMDLVYDDLDEVRTAAMRKHMEGCVECSRLHMSLTQGRSFGAKLEMLAAPALSVDVLAALDPAPAPALLVSPPIEPVAPEGSAPRWLRTLGEIAMRRQVAMAAVFLVMVGFGLRYAHHATTDAGSAVTEPSEGSNPVVIPATELPRPNATPENTPPAPAANALPHRNPPVMHRATPPAAVRPAPANTAVAHDDNAPTPPATPPTVVAPSDNAVARRDSLDAVLPPAPSVDLRGSNGANAADNQADRLDSPALREQQIATLRTALANAPDDLTRRQLTLRLIPLVSRSHPEQVEALERSLRVHENSLGDAVNHVPAPSPSGTNTPVAAPPPNPPQSSNSEPHPSVFRPSVARSPQRSVGSNAPSQANGF